MEEAVPGTIKTYSRKHVQHRRNSSVDVFDALFADNIAKRKEAAHTKPPRKRKKPIIIKELPPPDENHHLIEDSMHRSWGIDDTFDRIRKEAVYNNIKSVVMTTANSSSSHSSIVFTNSTPISHNTRGYKKRVISSTETSSDDSRNKKIPNALDESVNESLFIEKVPIFVKAPEISLLSCPSVIKTDGSVLPQMRSQNCNNSDMYYDPLFSKTFRETVVAKMHIASTPAVISSTPCISMPIVNETISPILNNTHPKSLIESYEEIEKWNFKPPDFPPNTYCNNVTPKVKKKKQLQPKILQKKKRTSKKKTVAQKEQISDPTQVSNGKPDWKLEGEAKIVLDTCLDVIGIEKSVIFANASDVSYGFSQEECQDVSKIRSSPLSIFEESFKQLCIKQNINYESPVRFITLRKRMIPVLSETKPKTQKTDLGLTSRKLIKASSLELNVNKNIMCSKQNNSSLSMQGGDINPTQEITTKLHNSSETSVTQNSVPSDHQEFSQTSVAEIPQAINSYGTILQPLTDNNNEDNKVSQILENIPRGSNRISSCDNNNRQTACTSQSIQVVEMVIGVKVQNIHANSSERPPSLDTIPNTPEGKRKRKAKYLFTDSGSSSNGCSKTTESLEAHGFSKQSRTSLSDDQHVKYNGLIDVTPNYHDSQMEGTVDSSTSKSKSRASEEDDNNYSKTTDNVIFINSDSRLCNELDQVEDAEVFKQKLIKYESSIFDDHNYSKVCIYDPEVIEVSSSEDEEEKRKSHNQSHASQILMKSDLSNEVLVLKSERFNRSNIPSEADDSSRSLFENTSLASHNSKKDSKADLDTDLDFSEFITSNAKCDLKDAGQVNDKTEESNKTELVTNISKPFEFKTPASVFLKPGKLWRRSLLLVRRSSIICDSIVCRADSGCICSCTKCRQNQFSACNTSNRRESVKIIPQSPQPCGSHDITVLEHYASSNITYGSNTIQDVVYREKNIGEPLQLVRSNLIHESLPIIKPSVTARDIVLRRCGQPEPLSFTECYPSTLLKNCFKIGEGVYGEVFLCKSPDGGTRAMKIIPIEGDQMVNGEHQKKFEEILSEIVIAMELSNLRNDKKNSTEGFSKVEKIRCVKGRYPERLLELWELFDETRGSENDSPEMFTDNQLYIVLELANGGQDMEAFVFNNALQAFNLFKQVACALAVGESALQFEHRDLHWGNILISPTDKNKKLTYCLNEQEFTIPACGIQASIIDFTLSRITYDGVCIFNDLSADPELFAATGDYQFEIYKLMQKHNGNQWQHFEPYSNLLWLHYVLDKMTSALRYKNVNSIVHKNGISKIKELQDSILKYSSVTTMVTNEFLS